MLVTSTRYLVANCVTRVLYFVNWDFDCLLKIEIELKSDSVACFCMLYVSTF